MAKIIPFPVSQKNNIDPDPFDRSLGLDTPQLNALLSEDPDQWSQCFTITPI